MVQQVDPRGRYMLKQCCLATRCSIRFSNLLYPFEPSFSPAPPKSTSRILNNSNLLEMSTSGRQQRNKREVNNKYRSEIWHTHTRNIYTQINYLCKCASSIHKCKCDDITAFELWQQRKLSQWSRCCKSCQQFLTSSICLIQNFDKLRILEPRLENSTRDVDVAFLGHWFKSKANPKLHKQPNEASTYCAWLHLNVNSMCIEIHRLQHSRRRGFCFCTSNPLWSYW